MFNNIFTKNLSIPIQRLCCFTLSNRLQIESFVTICKLCKGIYSMWQLRGNGIVSKRRHMSFFPEEQSIYNTYNFSVFSSSRKSNVEISV